MNNLIIVAHFHIQRSCEGMRHKARHIGNIEDQHGFYKPFGRALASQFPELKTRYEWFCIGTIKYKISPVSGSDNNFT
jgi:hypothetical protein